jgi:phospholipid transport system substrate-binding protein
MKHRLFLALLLAAPFVSYAAESSDEAQKRLHVGVDEVLGVAARAPNRPVLAERLRPVLEKYISFASMTRRAVGVGWRQFTPDQQKKATTLLSTLIIRSYSNKFTIGENPVINYLTAVSPAAGRVDVPTTIVYQGNRYSVTYRMEKEEAWLVTDIVIEGVSMVANYRSQLDPVYKKGGAEAVLSSLGESVARPQ